MFNVSLSVVLFALNVSVWLLVVCCFCSILSCQKCMLILNHLNAILQTFLGTPDRLTFVFCSMCLCLLFFLHLMLVYCYWLFVAFVVLSVKFKGLHGVLTFLHLMLVYGYWLFVVFVVFCLVKKCMIFFTINFFHIHTVKRPI